MEFRDCPRNRKWPIGFESGTLLVHSGFEPFCVWAEEEELDEVVFFIYCVSLSGY